MATYQPPTEQLQEFNSFVFRTNDTPLTINIGEDRFLRFNRAQGTEYFQDLVISGKLSTISDDIYGLIYGYQTTSSPTTGFSYFNTAFGYQAGMGYNTLSGGGLNSAFGAITMPTISGIAILNTAVGHNALWSLTTGSGNTGIGVNTQTSTITTGDANTCIGYNAKSFGNGSNSVIIGYEAVNTNGGVSIGYFSGSSIKSTSALRNIAIGNRVMGSVSPNLKTLGAGSDDNIAIGFDAMRLINGTGVARNIGLGALTTGSANSSGTNVIGTDMVCVGYNAGGFITNASFSTLVGPDAGIINAGTGIITATGNTGIGYRCATNIETTGINGVYIGRLTGVNFSNQNNNVNIGVNSNTSGSNQIWLGRFNWDTRWEKVAPLYTTVPTYNSTHIGFIQTAVITYPGATTNVIASYSAQAGTWCVDLVLNMLGGPDVINVRNATTVVGFVGRQTNAGIQYYNGSNYTVVSTGTATLDVLPLASGVGGIDGGSAGQYVRFIRVA